MMYRSGAVSNGPFTRNSSSSDSFQGRRNQGSLYSNRSSSSRRHPVHPPSSLAAGLATTVPPSKMCGGTGVAMIGSVPPGPGIAPLPPSSLHSRKHSSCDHGPSHTSCHNHQVAWPNDHRKGEEIVPRLMDPQLAERVMHAFNQRSHPLPRPNYSGNSSDGSSRLLLAVFQLVKGQVLTYFIYPTGELTELTERRRRLLRRYYDRGRQFVVLYLDEDNAEHYTVFPMELFLTAPKTTKKESKSSSSSNTHKHVSAHSQTVSRGSAVTKSCSTSSTASASGSTPPQPTVNSGMEATSSTATSRVELRKRTPRIVYKSPPLQRRSKSNEDVLSSQNQPRVHVAVPTTFS